MIPDEQVRHFIRDLDFEPGEPELATRDDPAACLDQSPRFWRDMTAPECEDCAMLVEALNQSTDVLAQHKEALRWAAKERGRLKREIRKWQATVAVGVGLVTVAAAIWAVYR